jgi:hypothetical protein
MVLRSYPEGGRPVSNGKTGEDFPAALDNIALGKDNKVEAWWDGPAEDDKSGAEGWAS